MVKEKMDAKQLATEQENIILKKKLADLEKSQAELQGVVGSGLLNEIKKIRQKGGPSANRLEVVEFTDHKNISLWTKWGKRIGPLHPDNAIQTLHRFADLGIILSADKPTQEQMEAWANSPEGKAQLKRESVRRDERQKSRRSGQMEKLASEIAKISGTTVEAINHILQASEVKKK